MSQVPVIAIDGPSASGKGTIARLLAERLGFHYLESGALYRLVALASLAEPVPEAARYAELARQLAVEFREGRTFLAGRDVTDLLGTEGCGRRASELAPIPAVREALLARQRALRRLPGLVADGRDMGSVVFPDAQLKVFLTASPQVRAGRRHKQLNDKGIHASLRALSQELEERDRRDTTRAVAPLVATADAVKIDSSDLDIGAVVDLIHERYLGRPLLPGS